MVLQKYHLVPEKKYDKIMQELERKSDEDNESFQTEDERKLEENAPNQKGGESTNSSQLENSLSNIPTNTEEKKQDSLKENYEDNSIKNKEPPILPISNKRKLETPPPPGRPVKRKKRVINWVTI